MPSLGDFSPYDHLFISMGLGLLVGLQREWAESTVAGIRSFTLISILGTTSALLSEKFGGWVIGVIFIGAVGISLLARQELTKRTLPHRGMVTEVSILLMYCVGIMVRTGPTLLAASIAVLIAFILQVKIELHTLAARFTKNEIRSIMQFMAISLLIFPVVPNQSFGPGNAINFHNVWSMVILITGVSLVGHIVQKFMEGRNGLFWTGILGGMISSTATTISYSKNSRTFESDIFHNSLIIQTAWWTLYLRIFLELSSVAPNFSVGIPLLTMSLTSGIAILWSWRNQKGNHQNVNISYNPTSLKTALSFALVYSLITYGFIHMKENTGNIALPALAFLSGIFDMDAVTLSTGRLVNKGILSHYEGYMNFYLALIANIISKGFMSLLIGGKKLFSYIFYPWIVSLFFAIGILLYHVV